MNQQNTNTVYKLTVEAQRNYEFQEALRKIKEVSEKCGLDVRVLIRKKKNNEQQ
jgi:uncharacterized protein (DUF302 family)